MTERSDKQDPADLLNKIADLIAPLNPPVFSFEKSIRTSPFRILISVLLSSRTKDKTTKQASNNLFSSSDSPKKILNLGEEKISQLIYPVGFYKEKAKNIIRICDHIIQSGSVPQTFQELVRLPGVGRKTANLVLALAFDIPAISVDIHVFRISRRIGWARADNPEQVESELKKVFAKNIWNRVNQTLVGFGQTICRPKSPACNKCTITSACEFYKNQQN